MKLLLLAILISAAFYGIVGMLVAADQLEDARSTEATLYVCVDGEFATPAGAVRPAIHCLAPAEER